jgi:hypothetical protein
MYGMPCPGCAVWADYARALLGRMAVPMRLDATGKMLEISAQTFTPKAYAQRPKETRDQVRVCLAC